MNEKNLEQIGFHKGSISTLLKEKEEFEKVLNIVNQLLAYHAQELKKLGVDLSEKKFDSTPKSENNLDELI